MTNCRLGAVPSVWVKIPQPVQGPTRFIGNQIGIVREEGIQERILSTRRIHRHAPHPPEQFVVRPGEVYVAVRPDRRHCNRQLPYTLTGKGRVMSVVQSSQWLPISVPPAVMVPVLVAVV